MGSSKNNNNENLYMKSCYTIYLISKLTCSKHYNWQIKTRPLLNLLFNSFRVWWPIAFVNLC